VRQQLWTSECQKSTLQRFDWRSITEFASKRQRGVKVLEALFGEERVRSASKANGSTVPAGRDPTLTIDKNGQRQFSQMAWINKRPTTSITAQVTP
jgi:hypothetical protein